METLLSKSLEKLHELNKKEVMLIEGSDYKVDFRDSDKVSILGVEECPASSCWWGVCAIQAVDNVNSLNKLDCYKLGACSDFL